MALIQNSNLADTDTDSFLTDLQATDADKVFGGSGYKEKKHKGEGEGGYHGGEEEGEEGGYHGGYHGGCYKPCHCP
jgi:hypothetical protein